MRSVAENAMSRSVGCEDDNGVLFHDRTEAGQLLAKRLMTYAARRDVLVLALPRLFGGRYEKTL